MWPGQLETDLAHTGALAAHLPIGLRRPRSHALNIEIELLRPERRHAAIFVGRARRIASCDPALVLGVAPVFPAHQPMRTREPHDVAACEAFRIGRATR